MLTIRAIRTEGVQVNRRGDWIFVVLETEEGLTGIGEASHSGNDRLVCGAVTESGRGSDRQGSYQHQWVAP